MSVKGKSRLGYNKTGIKKLLRQEAWGLARRQVMEALRQAPRDRWLHDKVAYTFFKQGRQREELVALRKCLRLFPTDAKFMSNAADALWHLDEEEKARKMCLKILRLKPRSAKVQGCTNAELRVMQNEARVLIGKIYQWWHKSQIARRWYADFIKHYRPGMRCFYSVAWVRNEVRMIDLGDEIWDAQCEGKWRKVKRLIDRYLRYKPDSFYFQAERGYACMRLGEYREGLKSVRKANRLVKDEPLGLWYEGRILECLRKLGEARRLYKRILRMSEEETGKVRTSEGIPWARAVQNDCRFRMGRIYAREGKRVMAKKWLRHHVAMRGKVPWNDFYMRTVRKVLADMDMKTGRMVDRRKAEKR